MTDTDVIWRTAKAKQLGQRMARPEPRHEPLPCTLLLPCAALMIDFWDRYSSEINQHWPLVTPNGQALTFADAELLDSYARLSSKGCFLAVAKDMPTAMAMLATHSLQTATVWVVNAPG